jgi:hypothetical protein
MNDYMSGRGNQRKVSDFVVSGGNNMNLKQNDMN